MGPSAGEMSSSAEGDEAPSKKGGSLWGAPFLFGKKVYTCHHLLTLPLKKIPCIQGLIEKLCRWAQLLGGKHPLIPSNPSIAPPFSGLPTVSFFISAKQLSLFCIFANRLDARVNADQPAEITAHPDLKGPGVRANGFALLRKPFCGHLFSGHFT